MSVVNNSASDLSPAHMQQLQQLNNQKGDRIVEEAKMSAKQEEVTAIAGRVKTLRFA